MPQSSQSRSPVLPESGKEDARLQVRQIHRRDLNRVWDFTAPFVATLVDVTGLVIYFSVAVALLRGTLL